MATDNRKKNYQNPLLRAGYVSKYFFWWLRDIFWYGKTHDLVSNDLYATIPDDLSENLIYDLESAWINEVNHAINQKRKASLWNVVTRLYFHDFIKLAAFPMCFVVIQIMQPDLILLIMSYFRPMSTMSPQLAYFNATIFVVLMILCYTSLCHGYFHLGRLGMRARIAFTSLIYKKMIRLPSSTNQVMGSSIISLLTIDVGKLELLFIYAPFIAFIPVQLVVVTCLIWRSVGVVVTVVSVGLMILQTFPVQAMYSKLTLKFRTKQATRTDNRVFLIGEIINGIKAIKMYVWEKYLEKSVYSARKFEIANYVKISYLASIVWSFTVIAHRLCALAVMLLYVLRHGVMTVDKILPVTQHLFILRSGICILFFFALRSITDMHVSMKRIEDFLLLKEVEFKIEPIENNEKEIISIENITASWNEKSVLFNNLSLDFDSKKLYTIFGSIGSGKSSILKLILGELQTVSGKVFIRGKVSFASQEPWLFSNTVKENILFGEKFDDEKYEKVIEACALIEDFRQFPYGDETLVGDKGSNLSGGQCARVNLARAVYRDADIYLFDDPLSAVDIEIAKKIMKKCVNELLINKTRILVANNIQLLNGVDEIVLLDHGNVEFRGNIEDFQRSNQHAFRSNMSDEIIVLNETVKELQINNFVATHKRKEAEETEKLIIKADTHTSVFLSYIKAGGWHLLCLVMLTNCLFLVTASIFDFNLGAWTNNDTIISNNSSFVKKTLIIFGGLIVFIIITPILKIMFLYRFALNASKNIHNNIFSRLIRATLQFFEANAAGKILNRFSEDTSVMDNNLPQALADTLTISSHVIAILISAILANWWILIPCSISIIISFSISRVCIKTIQKIKKLSGSARSPILSFAASSLAGATTIRACRAENIVLKDFNSRQDHYTAAQFLTVASTEAFSLWLQMVNLGFLAAVAYLCVFLKNNDTYEGYVGLSLMQVTNITPMISHTVKSVTDVFSHIISVERILQFKELEQETLMENESGLGLPNSWPNTGEIIFEHMYLRYSSDSDPVLWDLNCTIESKSKVGIVGRTGAGKSSLISALFRFAKVDGYLFIDGVDVKTADLYKLRSIISIIPQEPVLFKSSLRKNIDPSDKFDDATLWSVLEDVQLKNTFDSLEFPIDRGGNNLSAGQRQLICLARAIVSKNKILILDEATANVDSATDALIQATIRHKFKECTVLTIAHRLNTVMDSDKILVMNNGRMVEYDHPFLLLQKTDGYFFKMVQQTGNSTMEYLRNIAKQTFENAEMHDKSH